MTPPTQVTKLTTVIHGKVFGIWAPFPLPGTKADACKNAHLTCPLEPAKEVVYDFSLPVSKYYPSVSFIITHPLRFILVNLFLQLAAEDIFYSFELDFLLKNIQMTYSFLQMPKKRFQKYLFLLLSHSSLSTTLKRIKANRILTLSRKIQCSKFIFFYTFHIKQLQLVVKWELKDQNNDNLLCFNFMAKVQ